MRVVIIGNGVAGMEAALGVHQRNPDWKITIVSEESDHFFSRTALMWIVCGQMSHEQIEPLERDVYARLGFERVRACATGVDIAKQEVQLAGLPTLPYDRLLIACGSRPRPAPWPGSELEGVGSFVTMQDLEWLEDELHGGPSRAGRAPRPDAHLAHSSEDSPYRRRPNGWAARGGPPRKPMVVGGGLIGIEAIEVMAAAHLNPSFLIREEWFWPMAIDRAESTWIADRMRGHGVDVRLEENLERIEGAGRIERVTTDQGTHDCDLLVVAIGVVPNTDWLEGSDIERDRRGGLVVDPGLTTSARNVFAAGDCASVRWFDGAVRPEQLWYTARDQGRVAARALCGDTTEYARGHWYNSAKLMDIEYTTAGLVNMNVQGEQNFFFEETGEVRSTTRVVLGDDGEGGKRVVGFNLLGRRWDHTVLLRWIEEHRDLQYVLRHLSEASFDTEFVPPLRIARDAGELSGPAFSMMTDPTTPPAV